MRHNALPPNTLLRASNKAPVDSFSISFSPHRIQFDTETERVAIIRACIILFASIHRCHDGLQIQEEK